MMTSTVYEMEISIGDIVEVNKDTVSRAVYSPGKPFENKSFAQFYDEK